MEPRDIELQIVKKIKALATEKNYELPSVQIRFGSTEQEISTKIAEKWQSRDEISIKELLDISFDIFGKEAAITSILVKAMLELKEQLQIETENFFVFFIPWIDNNRDVLRILVFDGKTSKKDTTFEQMIESLSLEVLT